MKLEKINLKKVLCKGLHHEVQTLTLLCTVFNRKENPFIDLNQREWYIHSARGKRGGRGEGRGLSYERGADARQKFWIKPLKETNLGMAQTFLTP